MKASNYRISGTRLTKINVTLHDKY